jgi:hypothetical protein
MLMEIHYCEKLQRAGSIPVKKALDEHFHRSCRSLVLSIEQSQKGGNMKVTGYKLKNAIQNKSHERDVLAHQWNNSLKKFPDEEKRRPEAVMEEYAACERDLACLQTAQATYNLSVVVPFAGTNVSLLYVIKYIGGLGRIEKMWRTSIGDKNEYYHRGDERTEGTVYATMQLAPQQVMEATRDAARKASDAREAIAVGNACEMEIDVDPRLFK